MKKRYNDGGLPDYEQEPSFEDKAQQGAAVAEYKVEKGMNPNMNEDMTFKEAFAQARKDGDKKFKWHGKEYTTELAKPKAPEKFNAAKEVGAKPVKKAPEFMRKSMGMKAGGSVSASRRGDGIAQRGKTRGKVC